MIAYTDDPNFVNYEGGIYEHSGDESGCKWSGGFGYMGHRVTIVGYDDTNSCWICKNSIGRGWGENGWFRIKYGDCRIQDRVAYFKIDDFDITEFSLDFTMHRIKQIDDIDPDWAFHGEADWSYRVSVYNGLVLEHKSKKYCDEDDDHTEDVTHTFHIHSLTSTPTIIVKVWDRDSVFKDHDLADVSSKSGGGRDNNIDDYRKAMLHFKYDVVNDEIIEIDNVYKSNDGLYYTAKGDGNNNAKIWFKINKTEDYEPDFSDPDLSCSGSLSWSDVPPGSNVSGSFTVRNIGDSGSTLDWMVSDFPTWGEWSFVPFEDSGLTPEDGSFTVDVNVTAPLESDNYEGNIVIVNKYDTGDVSEIPVSLSVREPVADLSCSGGLSWSNVKTGDTVSGSFTVSNVGDPGSELSWCINSLPNLDGEHGTSEWDVSPMEGDGLKPEDDPVTVEVSVTIPDKLSNKDQDFDGSIVVMNRDDIFDKESISVYLSTPKYRFIPNQFNFKYIKDLNSFQILERLFLYITP
jgi:hypothetical protein